MHWPLIKWDKNSPNSEPLVTGEWLQCHKQSRKEARLACLTESKHLACVIGGIMRYSQDTFPPFHQRCTCHLGFTNVPIRTERANVFKTPPRRPYPRYRADVALISIGSNLIRKLSAIPCLGACASKRGDECWARYEWMAGRRVTGQFGRQSIEKSTLVGAQSTTRSH